MMGALLEVDGLRVSYRSRSAETAALRGASLTVDRGEVVALVGESGSGKSTLAHAILRLLPPGGVVLAGRVDFEGEDVLALDRKRLGRLLGRGMALVPQDAATFLDPTKRIGWQVAEVRRVHGLADRRTAAVEAVRLLATAGLPDPEVVAHRYPHELSGGMRQRVLIAVALAGEPSLIIADEPTSSLDVTVQKEVLDHLQSLVQQLDIALLLVTHDLEVAAERADRVVVMHAGEVVETGTASDLLAAPAEPYTRELVAAVPRLTDPPLVSPAAADDRVPALRLASVSRSYSSPGRGTHRAVADVDLAVPSGRSVGLVGESGSGKSTLARIAALLDRPDAGSVELAGVDTARLRHTDRRRLRRSVQLIHQSPHDSLDPRFTIARSIAEPLRAFGIGERSSRRDAIPDLLTMVGLDPGLGSRRPGELSGGQLQRVAIARALALQPSLLICDEPVSALDVSTQAQILQLLAGLNRDHRIGMVFVSHDLAVVRQICTDVVVLRHGTVVEAGTVDDVFGAPRHPYTRRLLDSVPRARTGDGVRASAP
ncbi:ABC transporter ATP-binding protein [Flexivirga sp. ID2601S]|uniref:ABC transporter ATP-binding protein n=1 Tax=Flexivirga aerilata TaxID=1656889 RepID=A0A849ABK4_9MICO|nr:ABC transporter ATP-binding protein [Flexivirga aerilata]NNG38284.1 ABC transporter ATP-binding protein [Flexivirga aerilata]